MSTIQTPESVQLPDHLGSNVYVVGITKAAQWMVPDAKQVAVDPDIECVRGDTAIAWSNGSPIVSRLHMAPPPKNMWQDADELIAIFVFEKQDGTCFKVDANRVDSIGKIIGGIDTNGEYFDVN